MAVAHTKQKLGHKTLQNCGSEPENKAAAKKEDNRNSTKKMRVIIFIKRKKRAGQQLLTMMTPGPLQLAFGHFLCWFN